MILIIIHEINYFFEFQITAFLNWILPVYESADCDSFCNSFDFGVVGYILRNSMPESRVQSAVWRRYKSASHWRACRKMKPSYRIESYKGANLTQGTGLLP